MTFPARERRCAGRLLAAPGGSYGRYGRIDAARLDLNRRGENDGMTKMMIAPYEVKRLIESAIEGAITTRVVPGSDGRTTPATSPSSSDDQDTRGNLLSRAWRFPAKLATRPKAAACATC